MELKENISLRSYNSFAIDARAKYFSEFTSTDELHELTTIDSRPAYRTGRLPTLILGGGSNILFKEDFKGLVLKNEIRGIRLLHEDNEHVYIQAGAGENWHQFVLYCIERNWAGLENLSLIPGNVGASPMQNIGAYGVELQDHFWELEAFHLKEKKRQTFTSYDCAFGYRDSIFKRKYKDQFAILNVTFQLRKKPIFHTSYGNLNEELEKMGVKELSIKAISKAVINIRSSKLPDPKLIGNAGSYFKNPVIKKEQFIKLKEKHPGIIGFEGLDGTIKLAAAWLIEQCGPGKNISWKGYRQGDAGCHEKQALVLVNYGNAGGDEIYELGEKIRLSVKKKFNVDLEREVNII
jgi:UDP-N-acetylmuramate dehydrogenase